MLLFRSVFNLPKYVITILHTSILYGFKSWSVIPRGERRFEVFSRQAAEEKRWAQKKGRKWRIAKAIVQNFQILRVTELRNTNEQRTAHPG